jgi:predicted DNA-binding transcriptional regulator YafY
MKINQKANQIGLMVNLIASQKTGSPHDFAQRLGISRSNMYQLIEEFNDMGVEIEYNRAILSFYFTKGKLVKVQTPVVIIDHNELQAVKGGFCIMAAPSVLSNFSHAN